MSDEQQTLFVEDTNARPPYAPRTHEVPEDSGEIISYKFGAGERIEMPLHHAMKFLCDEAFVVTDQQGTRIRPQPRREGGVAQAELKPDEVIATLDELTQQALFNRAKMRRGSDDLKRGTQKSKLIEFLLGGDAAEPAQKAKAPAAGGDPATAVDVTPDDDMSDIFGEEDEAA